MAFAAFILVVPGLSLAAPQTFNTALPVGKGNAVFRGQFMVLKAGNDPGDDKRDLTVLGGIPVLGYGLTSDLALFGMFPYINKGLELNVPGRGRITRGAAGFGDARIFARYTLFQRDGRGSTFRGAPFFGIELPTGADDDHDALGRLPQPLQADSGSWDPFGGVVVTYQSLDYQVDAQISYTANTQANDFAFGDELRFDASLQYRLLPRELDTGVPGFLYGVLETNLLYREKNRPGSGKDPDSGGTTLFVAPGLQYVTQKWLVEAIVQFPIIQDLNGTALKDDYTVRAGFRINF